MASGGSRGDVSPDVAHTLNEMRVATEKPRRIALLGSAPSSIKLAPFDDASWELWGCSPGCSQHLKPEQVHSWFEIHAFDKSRADLDADYIAFMRAIRGPVYMIAPVEELSNSVAYLTREMNRRTTGIRKWPPPKRNEARRQTDAPRELFPSDASPTRRSKYQ